ncbi:MAG TPA: glycosyltransferase family 1 protein, partial [Acidimicrobiales bacterium]|nr:glycosyltransferase family 1 protein [Acidimicrobiales bacterium]
MRVVVDAIPVRGRNSLAIVTDHLLAGWRRAWPEDDLHVVVGAEPGFSAPEGVTVHRVRSRRVKAQATELPALCRALDADALFAVLPTTTVRRLPCPRTIMLFDLRHELRPEMFSKKALLLRRVSWGMGFAQADGVVCISERTRRDLLRSHPQLRDVPVHVALPGADHVDRWQRATGEPPYALAFGQFNNKSVELVLDAWRVQRDRGSVGLPLCIVGVPATHRAALQTRIGELGLEDVVTVLPWLADDEFEQRFAAAKLVVFPSEFEGFGLPAVEALRLGIPLVISSDPALVEVAGGHAAVMAERRGDVLADAVADALSRTAEQLAAARHYAQLFTWERFAADTRGLVQTAVAYGARRTHRPVTPLVEAPVGATVTARPARRASPLPRWAAAAGAATLALSGLSAATYAVVAHSGTAPRPSLPSVPAGTTPSSTPGASTGAGTGSGHG